jgi:DNA-binding GntR family transcriptional regulator
VTLGERPPLRRGGGAQYAYDTLRAQVTSGSLPPNTRLYEAELVKQLGMSRTPVREALSMLLAEGLVVQLTTGGHVVAPTSAEEARQLYAVRAALEGLAARQAASNVDESQIQRMSDILEQMDRMAGFENEIRQLGHAFHTLVLTASGNEWLGRLLHQLRGNLDRYRVMAVHSPSRRDTALQEHRRILDALMAGDPDSAEDAMRIHVWAGATAAVDALPSDDDTTAQTVPT